MEKMTEIKMCQKLQVSVSKKKNKIKNGTKNP